ncbi:MAG: cbb3-type cytochrome c oxidase subunit 3 [Rhodobacterales bacterium]|nr:cbb3-type cytochrome c oxidase subunit 3 [Rhodobacterales bacterium]NCT11330.1 cbb3-type cytochrome c oxidase subunit 3 [Rhodobacterales bacterium]
METYTFLRQLADSWVMLVMLLLFIGMVLFLYRPGSRHIHDAAASVPFRHEDQPARVIQPQKSPETRS